MAANEMGFGRSPLRFRHIYAESAKKDKWYENIPTSKNAHDGRFIAANPRLLAVALESTGGGSFLVIPISRTGRMSGMNPPRVCGHAGPILDLAWHPYDDSLITSASEDSTVKLWRVDIDEGLSADLTAAEVELRGHRRRAMYIDWHPSARDVLLSAGYDHQIILWNVECKGPFQTLTCHNQPIQSIGWHPEGRLIVSTSKDKTVRVMDPRSGAVVMSGANCHLGPKASKALFLDEDHLFTVGSGRHSDREYCVWSLENGLATPIQRQTIDQSSGIIVPYYDPDCKVVYLMGKGDGNFRYYEYSERNVHYLNQHISSVPQRGVGVLPKRGLDMDKCEIFRFYKLHVTANVIEPLSIIAPRRGHFRDDLYPPTASQVPALTAEQWCYHGLNRTPVLMSLQDGTLINPPTAAGAAPAPQTRPSVPASLRNIGHLAATGEQNSASSPATTAQKPPQQSFGSVPPQPQAAPPVSNFGSAQSQPHLVGAQQPLTLNLQPPGKGPRSHSLSPQPASLSSQAHGPSQQPSQNGHHHVQLSKSPQAGRATQRCRMTGAERRSGGRFSTDLGIAPASGDVPPLQRRSSTSGADLGESQLAPGERLDPARSPAEAQAEHVPSFKSLVQAFEKPSPSEESVPFLRNRRAQSMRERSWRPRVTEPPAGVTANDAQAEPGPPKLRTRYIRRPESLQSPEEQRKSIELSLQHRTVQQCTDEGLETARMGAATSLESLVLPSVRDLVAQREEDKEERTAVSMPSTPGPATSSKIIEMKPRQIAIPETYDELREAFLQQQTEIRTLRFELERRDRDLARLREQLVAKKKAFKGAPAPVDSSFC